MKYLPYDLSPEELIHFTPEWQGERFSDGRPRVSDEVLEAVRKYVSLTFAWGVLKGHGYRWQFLRGFESTLPREKMVGRAVTALYVPRRPDLRQLMLNHGHEEGEIGDMISWPIDRLVEGDVYVADVFGKLVDGPIIGERLASSIFANSANGVVHNAAVRDLDAIERITGMNVYHRGFDPTHASPETIMLLGINCPMRMNDITIMPGDVVLAEGGCVVFIPPHLAEYTAFSGMIEVYRDLFSVERMKTRTYTPGQIDGKWSDEIQDDFYDWLDRQPDVPFSRADMDRLDQSIRTW